MPTANKRPAAALAAGLACVLAAGCGGSKPAPPANVLRPAQAAKLAPRQGEFLLLWERALAAMPPYAKAGKASAVNGENRFWCVVSQNGETRLIDAEGEDALPPFDMPNESEPIVAAAACNDKLVAAVDNLGVLHVASVNGKLLWSAKTGMRPGGAPLIASGRLFVVGVNGQMRVYSARRGELLWHHTPTIRPPVMTTRADSSPQVAGNAVYVGGSGGVVAALRVSDGALLWENSLRAKGSFNPARNIAAVPTPVAAGGLVCVAGYQSALACLDSETGELLWQKDFSALLPPVFDAAGGRVYAAGVNAKGGGVIRGYLADSGELLWENALFSAPSCPPEFIFGAILICEKENGVIRAFAPDSGEQTGGRGVADGSVIHLQKTGNDTLLALTQAGELALARFDF